MEVLMILIVLTFTQTSDGGIEVHYKKKISIAPNVEVCQMEKKKAEDSGHSIVLCIGRETVEKRPAKAAIKKTNI